MKVSVIGLGKLGNPFLGCLWERDFEAIGHDKREIAIVGVDSNEICIFLSDITFIIVGTPSLADGSFSNEQLKEVCRDIGHAIKKKRQYHLVVIVSTVSPGSIRKVLIPCLENSSGKKVGKDFGLCYNPFFVNLKTLNFLNPDFVLIGEHDKRSGDLLEKFYDKFLSNKKPIKRMSIENAEVCKLALNCYLTTKISYANLIWLIAQKIKGGNSDQITEAIGCDSRIGGKYFKGGWAFSGPCFPRDVEAFSKFFRDEGVTNKLMLANKEINATMPPEKIVED